MRPRDLTRKARVPSLIVAIVTFSLLTLAVAATAQQPERGVPHCESVPVHHLHYGEHTQDAGIGPTGADTDAFSFEGTTGDVVRIVARGYTNDLDVRIRLFGPGSTGLLHDGYCNVNQFSRCSNEHLTPPLPATGTYTIIISDQGSNNSGAYQMQIDRLWPIAAAPPLSYVGAPKYEGFSTPTDVDFFTFAANATTFFDLFVTGTTNDLDLYVSVRDATGAVVISNSCSVNQFATCQVVINFSPGMVTLPGIHYVEIKEAGADNTGNYNVSLQCLTPPCPNNPLVPCGTATPVLTVTGMEPSVFSSNGGYAGRLLGTGFCGNATPSLLSIGGNPVSGAYVPSANEIRFTVPSLAPGSYDLTVTTSLQSLTLPAFVVVREAALTADQLFTLGGHGDLAIRASVGNAPLIVLADLVPGTTSLGIFGQSQLDLFSPTLIAITDASGVFGPSIACVTMGGWGDWFFRPPVPNDPALSGLLFYCEAYVVDGNAPNTLFHQTNLATVGF